MPKQEREFFDPEELSWQAVAAGSGAAGAGVEEKVLSFDADTGNCSRLLKFAPGVETDEVITHDFCEEVIILEGELHDKRLNQTFTTGMYACRQPGMPHGPYVTSKGCMTFEVRYYPSPS
jgi:anti-sigma factor ChrR (cupin superfamily)